jgi:release factor glutamine methyltransferase
VGTGSGAIALALAQARPELAVFATDISPGALEVARENARRLGLAVTWLEGRLADPLRAHASFNLICGNLPYVPSGVIAGLAPEVCCEPRIALDGGLDGLDLQSALAREALPLLIPGGTLALEVGAPLELTWSCYDPQEADRSCPRCDACKLRLRGFAEAGVTDPIESAGHGNP